MRLIPWGVHPSKVDKDFEKCWRKMCEDLRTPKIFKTTGGSRTFKVWSEDFHLYYEKSTGDICPLSKSDFKKAHDVFLRTGSLNSATYQFTMHGSYIPPLLYKYFVREQ